MCNAQGLGLLNTLTLGVAGNAPAAGPTIINQAPSPQLPAPAAPPAQRQQSTPAPVVTPPSRKESAPTSTTRIQTSQKKKTAVKRRGKSSLRTDLPSSLGSGGSGLNIPGV
jgi:hypothetical protein